MPSLLGFGPALVESDDVRMPVGSEQLASVKAAIPALQPARAALIMDPGSGRVMLQRNSQDRLPTASLAKIMTAVVVLERADPEEQVPVTRDDFVEGSAMGLRPGDTLTVEQLLWGMLLPSGNDAAAALARHVGGGSVGAFVEMMNEKARALGLTDTNFTNPHGLDSPAQYTTALDVARLTRHALGFPLFRQIVGTREYTVRANRTFALESTNPLLQPSSGVQGVTGVKTGTTDRGGASLVASAERDGRRLLVVVLGASDRAAAASFLLEYAFDNFVWVPASLPMLTAGAGPELAFPGSSSLMLPHWQRFYVNASVEVGPLGLQQTLPGPAALATFYLAGEEVERFPLYVRRR